MIKTITKEFSFDASHRLEDSKVSEQENKEIFGKCFNYPSHGHTYKMFVTISGGERHGMIINFTELKKIVNEEIIDKLDHQFLNEVDMFKNEITTCEVMVEIIWEILEPKLRIQSVTLEEIKLYETPTSYATVKRG